jgi:hypothetical protein
VLVDGEPKVGFNTPSAQARVLQPTLRDWGWPEKEYVVPWPLESHVHPDNIDRKQGRDAAAAELPAAHAHPHPQRQREVAVRDQPQEPGVDAPRGRQATGVQTGDLVRVETEIGYFIDKVWVTEGIKPGIIAMSHHLGRWRLQDAGGNPGMSALAELETRARAAQAEHRQARPPWKTFDPDTSRIWWKDVGVHQNLTHAVHPDPISGAHCWLQKAVNVRKAAGEKHGDVWVDTEQVDEGLPEWVDMTRSAVDHSPDGTRRPYWLKRPLKPVKEAYKLPEQPFGR